MQWKCCQTWIIFQTFKTPLLSAHVSKVHFLSIVCCPVHSSKQKFFTKQIFHAPFNFIVIFLYRNILEGNTFLGQFFFVPSFYNLYSHKCGCRTFCDSITIFQFVIMCLVVILTTLHTIITKTQEQLQVTIRQNIIHNLHYEKCKYLSYLADTQDFPNLFINQTKPNSEGRKITKCEGLCLL